MEIKTFGRLLGDHDYMGEQVPDCGFVTSFTMRPPTIPGQGYTVTVTKIHENSYRVDVSNDQNPSDCDYIQVSKLKMSMNKFVEFVKENLVIDYTSQGSLIIALDLLNHAGSITYCDKEVYMPTDLKEKKNSRSSLIHRNKTQLGRELDRFNITREGMLFEVVVHHREGDDLRPINVTVYIDDYSNSDYIALRDPGNLQKNPQNMRAEIEKKLKIYLKENENGVKLIEYIAISKNLKTTINVVKTMSSFVSRMKDLSARDSVRNDSKDESYG